MIKKIRINKNNNWYLKELLGILLTNYPIDRKTLRNELLQIIKEKNKLCDTKTLIKLNDTLYTYSIQYCDLFEIINTKIRGKILPNNLTVIFYNNVKLSENNKGEYIQKLLLYIDYKKNIYLIPKLLKNEIEIEEIRKYYKQNRGEIFVEKELLTYIEILLKSDLIIKNELNKIYLNKDLFEKIRTKDMWNTYEDVKKMFEWGDILKEYNKIVLKTKNKKINLQLLISELSIKFNCLQESVEKIIVNIPLTIKGKKVYLIQGRLDSSDSIEISKIKYNAIEIK